MRRSSRPSPIAGNATIRATFALVGNALAKVKGFEPEVLAAVSWMNAEKAFGLGKRDRRPRGRRSGLPQG